MSQKGITLWEHHCDCTATGLSELPPRPSAKTNHPHRDGFLASREDRSKLRWKLCNFYESQLSRQSATWAFVKMDSSWFESVVALRILRLQTEMSSRLRIKLLSAVERGPFWKFSSIICKYPRPIMESQKVPGDIIEYQHLPSTGILPEYTATVQFLPRPMS
jgi:hypothetical protein